MLALTSHQGDGVHASREQGGLQAASPHHRRCYAAVRLAPASSASNVMLIPPSLPNMRAILKLKLWLLRTSRRSQMMLSQRWP